MNKKIVFALSLLLGLISITNALATNCPSAGSSTTVTNSCSTGIIWTGGNLTIGNGSNSISITNTNLLVDGFTIEANSSSLGSLTNKVNSTIGDNDTGNGIQNDSDSAIVRLYNFGSIIAGNGVWNDGNITTLYNFGSITASNGGIWNNGGITTLSNFGSITVGDGQNGTYNNGLISTLNNSGSITAGDTGTGIANDSSGIITTLNNSGSITVGAGTSRGIANGGIITTLNNSGSLTLLDGYGILNGNAITTLNNSGSINLVDGKGIWNIGASTITTLNNSGSIDAGGGDILNDGTIITLNNSALLTGTNVGITNQGTLYTFNNIDSILITSADSGTGIGNTGTFASLNNFGSIIVEGTNGTAIGNGGDFAALNNYGVITVGDGGNSIYNSESITTLTNLGAINTGNSGTAIYNDGSGNISTLTNLGSITAGTFGIDVRNGGILTTLNNSQGGNASSAATTSLSYTGNSPTNYNIGIVSSTHYGQLVTDPSVTIDNVGIYGTPLLTSRTYAGVLSNDVTVTNLQNQYDNMTVALVNNADTGKLDLTFSGVSLMGTQLSLINNTDALIPIYTLQNTVLVNSFTYDCNLFDVNNVCVSAGGRNTGVSAAHGLNNTSALLIAAYRPHPTYRIGAYVDQNLSVKNSGSTVKLDNNTPLLGLFAVWNERLNGTGAEIKISAAYGQKNATINRQVVGLSESGSGSSSLNSQGAQVIAKYGFGITENILISPYIGMRYTQNNMGGYRENASSSVTVPLTYGALNTNSTTALAGVGASYRFKPQAIMFASAGVETDTNTTNSAYSATGISGLTSVNFNPNPVKTRPTATLGASYDLGKNQRVGIAAIYRQEPLRAISTTTLMATYTVGM